MCWSGEASAVLALTGFAGTAYAAYRKEPFPLWIALGYFSLMELLQAFTYGVIDQCALPDNQIATMLGYLHIVFQPFFVNAFCLHFVPKEVAQKLYKPVFALCFVATLIMILQVFPFDWAGQCNPVRWLCSDKLCSVHGNWHIAWLVPLNGIGNWFADNHWPPINAYSVVGFLLPILYGSWRMTLYHLALGPLLAMALTSNINEIPAVWCLLSIGLLLIVVKTPIRQFLYVKSWPLWRLIGYKEPS